MTGVHTQNAYGYCFWFCFSRFLFLLLAWASVSGFGSASVLAWATVSGFGFRWVHFLFHFLFLFLFVSLSGVAPGRKYNNNFFINSEREKR
jgi:hypothetical protein